VSFSYHRMYDAERAHENISHVTDAIRVSARCMISSQEENLNWHRSAKLDRQYPLVMTLLQINKHVENT